MTIIEFAYLSLPPPTTSTTPKLLQNLVTVTDVIQASSHLPNRFFSSTTDDSVMFVIGGWPSQSAHQNGFDGSAEQAKLFPLIEGMMQIDWMEYLDTPHDEVPTDAEILVAVVLKCGMRSDEEKRKIWDGLGTMLHSVADALKKGGEVPMVYAWNLKKGKQADEEDVLVCFSGWESMGDAQQFGKGVSGKELSEWAKTPEVYYMKKTELG